MTNCACEKAFILVKRLLRAAQLNVCAVLTPSHDPSKQVAVRLDSTRTKYKAIPVARPQTEQKHAALPS